jgi:fluoride exporter
MSPLVVLGIGLLGGTGAIARFLLDGAVSQASGREFPYGTMAVNVLGSFVLGAFAGAALGNDASRLAGTGLVGAFTTFSTWAFESHRLGEDGRLPASAVNVALSLVLGVTAAWAGRHLGSGL